MKISLFIRNIKGYIKKQIFLTNKSPAEFFIIGLVFIFVALLDVAGIGVISPLVTSMTDPDKVRDLAQEYFNISIESNKVLLYVSILTILIFLTKSIMAFLAQKYILKFSFDTRSELIHRLTREYVSLPITYHQSHNVASIIQKIQGHTNLYIDRSLLPLMRSLSEAVVLIAIAALLVYMAPFIMFSALTLLITIILIYNKLLRGLYLVSGQQEVGASERVIQYVREAISGLRELKVLKVEDFFINRVKRSAETQAKAAIRSQSLTILPRYILESVLISFVIFVELTYYLMGSNMSEVLPILGIFAIASFRIIPSLNQISVALSQSSVSSSVLDDIYHDLSVTNNWTAQEGEAITRENQKEIVHLDNVTYVVNSQLVLDKITLKIYTNDFIGIVGESGSGKTTLINIISGLLSPTYGRIAYGDNQDKKVTNATALNISLVDQDPLIIHDTLRRNIALGVRDDFIDDDKIKEAIFLSELDTYFNSVNNDLDHILSGDGLNISGGQKQRIALARAIYSNKEILILDEPTSGLDKEAEKKIFDTICKLRKTKTIVLITHNIDLMNYCDRIIKIQNHKLAEVCHTK